MNRVWGWIARHRRALLLTTLVLALAARIALPPLLRRVVESQANAALAGRVVVGDLDLHLLRGGVALDEVTLHREDAPPGEPAVVAFRRFYVQIGYLPFLFRTVRIEDVSLDGLVVDVDRLEDGTLALPALRPAPPGEEAAPEEEPAEEESEPWSIVVDHAALREGRVTVDDRAARPPTTVSLGFPAIELSDFRLQYGPDADPGEGVITARFGEGRIRLKTSVATRRDGFAYGARLDVDDLPLDRMHVHVPQLRWSALRGRLDAGLTLSALPAAVPTVRGTVALRDVQVDVPDEQEPALAWKRLEVEIEKLDAGRRVAHVRRVVLDRAGVIVEPREPVPLPILAREEGGAPPPDAAPDEPAGEPGEPWRWRVDAVDVTDSMAKVVLEPPPLSIGLVRLAVRDLSSDPGTKANVELELREGDGTVGVEGTLGLDPLAATQRITLRNLAVERLLAATGAVPAQVAATVDAAIDVAAEQDPVTISGTLGVHELAVRTPAGEDFAFGWRDFEAALREVVLPGVLPGSARDGRPIRVALARLRLDAPNATLTRTPEGLVLPTGASEPAASAAAAAEAEAAEPAAPPAEPAAPSAADADAAPAAVEIVLDQIEIVNGLVAFTDRSVTPPYRGRVSSLKLDARNVRHPENTFDAIDLSLRAPGGAPLDVDAARRRDGIRVQAKIEGLPLSQFNPYVKDAAGYSIARGKATFGADVRWDPRSYTSENRITVNDLTVAGAEGDSLFLQRFGIPLTLAIGLMKDMTGTIELGVPVKGDRAGGARLDLGAVIGEALARAIVNAIASPLKLIGAVNLTGDRVGAIAPEPIGFIPGLAEVADDAWWRVEQLVHFLNAVPSVALSLGGVAGAADARALSEAAVLKNLEATNPALGALRNVASGGARGAIRDALQARVRGAPGPLEPDEEKLLDEWVAEKPVADDALRALAVSRAERLQRLLADYGIDPARIRTGDPKVDRTEGKPRVVIDLATG